MSRERVLAICIEFPGATLHRIAAMADLSPSTASYQLAGLVADGQLEKWTRRGSRKGLYVNCWGPIGSEQADDPESEVVLTPPPKLPPAGDAIQKISPIVAHMRALQHELACAEKTLEHKNRRIAFLEAELAKNGDGRVVMRLRS